MRCFLCNTILNEQLYAEHSILKCSHCNKYYIEGETGSYKRFLKRRSSKIIRKLELEKIGDGNNYRKVFPLWWEWF